MHKQTRRYATSDRMTYRPELLEPRRLLAAGPTTAAPIEGILAPGDVLASAAVQIGPHSFFFARDGAATTAHLWRTDGTPSGTVVTDVTVPVPIGKPDPRPLFVFNGRLMFVAEDAGNGRELWLTGGTAADTNVISSFADPAAAPTDAVIAGGQVFFTVADAEAGQELWRTDGTLTGTRRVKDIRPGPMGSSIDWLTPMNGVLYFVADDGARGSELWSSDGSEASTNVLVDLIPGPGATRPAALYADAGRLFFAASAGTTGDEPWVSDGTAAGTRLVADVNPGPQGSFPTGFVSFDGKVYFNAFQATTGRELWRTDGTPAGTELALDLSPGRDDFRFGGSVVVGDRLYFDGPRPFGGQTLRYLYVTDGTPAGTVRLFEGSPFDLENLDDLTAFDDRVVFVANFDPYGHEPWITDGTAAGTRMIRDLGPREVGSRPTQLSVLPNGSLYFAATDFFGGAGPWVSDGTGEGTRRLAEIPVTPVEPSAIQTPHVAGDWLYVSVDSWNMPRYGEG
jgi:large repetitive protein